MGTVGRSAIIPDNIPKAINTKHLACLTIDRSKAQPTFICSAFQMHPEIRQQLTGQAKGDNYGRLESNNQLKKSMF